MTVIDVYTLRIMWPLYSELVLKFFTPATPPRLPITANVQLLNFSCVTPGGQESLLAKTNGTSLPSSITCSK